MPKKTTKADSPNSVRLQKVLASAGFGSRRQCEELIVDGRVSIDKKQVFELGTKVDTQESKIHVDGVLIKPPRLRYFLLHKPTGVVSTAADPWARTRVIDLVDSEERLFTVGRLDKDSSGLILCTNDGQLANGLAHPRYQVSKTYHAIVVGKPSIDVLRQLRKGIHLSETFAKMQSVTLKKPSPKKSTLEIILTEGKNREIRRLLARVGHKVVQLKRVALGAIRLGDLPVGAYRELTRNEIKALYAEVQGKGRPRKSSKKSDARRTPGKKGRPAGKRAKKISGAGDKKMPFGLKKAGAVIGNDANAERPAKETAKKRTTKKYATSKRTTKKHTGKKYATSKHTTKKHTGKKHATKKYAGKGSSIKKKVAGGPKAKRRPAKKKTNRRR